MKFLFGNDWVRRQIEGDPDVETGAGRVISSSADVLKAMEEVRQYSSPAQYPLNLRSGVRVDRQYQLAAFPGQDLRVAPWITLPLVDKDRNLNAKIMLRAGDDSAKLQVCWLSGAIVELRADEHNAEPQALPLDGTWLDLDWGTLTIDDDDDFVSRTFELQPRVVSERSGSGGD